MHFGQFSKSIRNGFRLNTKYSENLFSEYFLYILLSFILSLYILNTRFSFYKISL
ncbi:hypothetical protein SAMN05421796_1037 [Chryseobacterium piscicola]|uniref:Uncharacterized protein n=1 Tax=Chryseobacterium piscicola TaxID=551459 RepID=A0A1N7LQM0_9FLAO|nr:hypothetical protein SAMN05421796_1037 [Chryseobacterium piscicola]